MDIVLYNSKANAGHGLDNAKSVLKDYVNESTSFVDLVEISDLNEYFLNLDSSKKVVLTGGDGTINNFINRVDEKNINNELYYIPSGTGNDFYTDIKSSDEIKPLLINKYLKNLPTVIVNNKKYKFINGVGYGIDGYCCEVADELASKGVNDINYASIAIKGMLGKYKPCAATIQIDDNEPIVFKRTWLAPTMKGRYYGGGMKVTPNQDRNDETNKVSLMCMHGGIRLKTLIIFSKIFKGEHIKFKKRVSIFEGNKIKVIFSSPRALQVDGETIKNVTSYEVLSK